MGVDGTRDSRGRTTTSNLRHEGILRALATAGVATDPDLFIDTERYRQVDGARAAARLLASPAPPDAIICFNDLVATGLLAYLGVAGVRVPQDIAVASFDGTEVARYTSPRLTTVAWDRGRIAREALDLLAARLMTREPAEPVVRTVEHRIVVRESTVAETADRTRLRLLAGS